VSTGLPSLLPPSPAARYAAAAVALSGFASSVPPALDDSHPNGVPTTPFPATHPTGRLVRDLAFPPPREPWLALVLTSAQFC
jgi:hypothetical protein